MNGADYEASPLSRLIRFCLEHKLVVFLAILLMIGAGLMTTPFDWDTGLVPRDPVGVDAIPDLGENQQIIFTEWPGRSPQDVEDQITYPLTVSLLGLPEVRTVRSYSYFGFSSIYVIFKERTDFYDSRSRILEKLASLPAGTLPEEVRPALGPDATALGQVFWYTLEGRDENDDPAGGWDPDELRSIQDWYVRYGLLSAEGVAEVASVGGFVREYQIDVNPEAMRAHGVGLDEVFRAVRESNVDVGARSIEINKVEYVIRGLGFLEGVEDIEGSVITVRDGRPITIGDVAHVVEGPALRRGVLDKGGAEAVGGVVVVRHGANPLQTIKNVQAKIAELAPGMPSRTLEDGRLSKLTVVPFYDRSELIHETLGTLKTALIDEILVTIIVVLVLLMNLRSGLLVSGLLPLAVLMVFAAMRVFGLEANIVALSGIAIAIGTMVDMGVILTENIQRGLETASPDEDRLVVVHRASVEVAGAILTAVATTIISFLPVFTMEAAEGKLFKPLAWTKSFALAASVLVALTVIPPMAHLLMRSRRGGGVAKPRVGVWLNWVIVGIVAVVLTRHWLPLGPERGLLPSLFFVLVTVGGLLLLFHSFKRVYPQLLGWCLDHKATFLVAPLLVLLLGGMSWRGFDSVFGFLPHDGVVGRALSGPRHTFPGLGREFMPPLDEGSFLYMPTTMPHASIGEATDVLTKLDMAMASVPEVAQVVGKLGRAESALDPAPISMVETVVNYHTEYRLDEEGRRLLFKHDGEDFLRDDFGELIPDRRGRPFRQWREHIHSSDDIWDEIVKAAKLPGTTSAPKLQPIAARLVMLQSGMRAPMGVKVKGPDLETIDLVVMEIESLLKEVPGVEPSAVIADRMVGKPYLEVDIDREAAARYGLSVRRIQDVLEVAVGGRTVTTTVEGRERYPVRVRYARERRDTVEDLARVLVPAPDGTQIPLSQLAEIRYVRGPQAIKSEDTFLIGYVLFDKKAGQAEVDVVEAARDHLEAKRLSGEFVVPEGVSYVFAGSYENQVRSQKRLRMVLPLALALIFLILYLQFRSTATAMMVFSGVFVAWAGGFVMIWLYGQPWFLDAGGLRDLFQVHTINLSVAIWVGFIALFGIATDDGVVMATYLDQTFRRRAPKSRSEIRRATIEAAARRVRPALMTTATTILALLPILTSKGRGSDIMVPMAIPSVGGMLIGVMTMLIVPVLYCWFAELKNRSAGSDALDE